MQYLGFLACATAIFYAGRKLSFYGDLLAEKTGLSKGWIGLILMASVTSLPELMVGISSSAIIKSADLAVGDILGSCAFNLGILAVMDAFSPGRKPLFGIASQSHLINAGLGVVSVSLVGLALFLPYDYPIMPWIALSSIVFIIVYFLSVAIIYRNEKKLAALSPVAQQHDEEGKRLPLKKIILFYSLFAIVIVLAALALPYFAEQIAESTGLGKSFVGTLFLAASTSLPEIAVSLAAIRAGSIDLAVGNLLGSNIFNIFILAIDDIFYTKGFLLKDASEFHLISVLATIMMSAVAIIGLSYRSSTKKFVLALDSAIIFGVYIVSLVFIYRLTA
ncbi:hypothetical protein [Pollutibacter soli]|uniref:sodium:calcium antiporter n=1 Tax=Pollutibacter soli TaxID=3034157 RepID=UPI003014178B